MRTRSAIIIALVAGLSVTVPASGGLVMNEDLGSQTILNDVLTTETSLDYTLDLGGPFGMLRVRSAVEYNPVLDRNTFDYVVFNESGAKIHHLAFYGEQWVSGLSWSGNWAVAPSNGWVDFYDWEMFAGNNDEFILGSTLTNSWGIGSARFYLDELQWVDVGVLKPTTVPEPATLSLLALGGLAIVRRRCK